MSNAPEAAAVRMTFTVSLDVDVDAYAAEYGELPSSVAADVLSYLVELCGQSAAANAGLWTVARVDPVNAAAKGRSTRRRARRDLALDLSGGHA